MRKTMMTVTAAAVALGALAAFGGVTTASAQGYGMSDQSEIGGMECQRRAQSERCGGWSGAPARDGGDYTNHDMTAE